MMSVRTLYALLTGINVWGFLFRIALSALIGGLVGSERGRHGRAAGLRTHILVCLGSSITAMTGLYLTSKLGTGDPARLSAQVISGIGFLGAGTILTRNHAHVTGLTTAACLWVTATIGLSIGFGFYEIALPGFFVVVLSNTLFPKMERRRKIAMDGEYYLELSDIHCVNDFFDRMTESLSDMRVVPPKSAAPSHVGICCRMNLKQSNNLLTAIRELEYVVIAIPFE